MMTTDVHIGGLPGYAGLVERTDHLLPGGVRPLSVETWPDYRIGSTLWPSGKLLARALAEKHPCLPDVSGMAVVELGAGPGLPGLASACLGAREVVLTDREELVPLMSRNIDLNDLKGNCRAETLDWPMASESPLSWTRREKAGLPPFDIVLAADVVYFEEQDPLVEAITSLLAAGTRTLVLAYRERSPADRMYLEQTILPKLVYQRIDYETPENGKCEIYVGQLRSPPMP